MPADDILLNAEERMEKAVEVLRSLGFNSVLHLHRGMMAWRWAGKAVTDGESRTTPSQ